MSTKWIQQAAQIGGYLRTGHGPAAVAERERNAGPPSSPSPIILVVSSRSSRVVLSTGQPIMGVFDRSGGPGGQTTIGAMIWRLTVSATTPGQLTVEANSHPVTPAASTAP